MKAGDFIEALERFFIDIIGTVMPGLAMPVGVCYAFALEMGFAMALGKFVILVDEKSTADAQAARYSEMLSAASDVSFKTLQEGIKFLDKYRTLA